MAGEVLDTKLQPVGVKMLFRYDVFSDFQKNY